jgi:hypothetical protein
MFYKLSLIKQTARAGWRHIFRAAGLGYDSILMRAQALQHETSEPEKEISRKMEQSKLRRT